MMVGLERERLKNSGHPLFLASRRDSKRSLRSESHLALIIYEWDSNVIIKTLPQ